MTKYYNDGMDVYTDFLSINKSIISSDRSQLKPLNKSLDYGKSSSIAPTDQLHNAAKHYIQETGDPTGLMSEFLDKLNSSMKAWDEEFAEKARKTRNR